MGANRYMVDSGGVTRHIRKRYVIDSGGTARLIKKRYIVDSGGTTRLTFLFADLLSMVAGDTLALNGQVEAIGFQRFNWGSISPTTLGDGMTVGELSDQIRSAGGGLLNPPLRTLVITGFSSNPGQGYLDSLTLNGLTLQGLSAATYSYGSPSATWVWPITSAQVISVGATYPVQIAR